MNTFENVYTCQMYPFQISRYATAEISHAAWPDDLEWPFAFYYVKHVFSGASHENLNKQEQRRVAVGPGNTQFMSSCGPLLLLL